MTPRQVLRLSPTCWIRRGLRMTLRLPDPCLVVLVGATGGGQVGVGAQVVPPRTGRVVGPAAGGRGAGERDQRRAATRSSCST